jgi:hypothetical protein
MKRDMKSLELVDLAASELAAYQFKEIPPSAMGSCFLHFFVTQ